MKVPPELGLPVSWRSFSFGDMARRSWGSEFSAPDHRVYEFSNGRGFDSTDRGGSGLYLPTNGNGVACSCGGTPCDAQPINQSSLILWWDASQAAGAPYQPPVGSLTMDDIQSTTWNPRPQLELLGAPTVPQYLPEYGGVIKMTGSQYHQGYSYYANGATQQTTNPLKFYNRNLTVAVWCRLDSAPKFGSYQPTNTQTTGIITTRKLTYGAYQPTLDNHTFFIGTDRGANPAANTNHIGVGTYSKWNNTWFNAGNVAPDYGPSASFHLYAFTFEKAGGALGSLKFYYDGVLQQTTAVDTGSAVNASPLPAPLYSGVYLNNTLWTSGNDSCNDITYGPVMAYGYAMSDAEITDLFNAYACRFGA